MAEDELLAFREHWKQELTIKNEAHSNCNVTLQPSREDSKLKRYFEDFGQNRSEPEKRQDSTSQGSSKGGQDAFLSAAKTPKEDQPEYVSIAEGLLDGRTSPLLERIQEERTRRKRQYHSLTSACNTSQQQPQRKINKGDKLVDQFIQDLNETNDIPFFDIELPYELALKIFQYLSRTELGRCAQVSKAWGVLAEDEVLWFRMCQTEGYHHGASVSDSPCWKSMLRDCRNSENTVRSNWKNRVGSISQLQYELGKVLCDVSSCDSYVVAGYTSGDVRLWDTLHWDSAASFLKPSPLTADVTPRPHVSHIRVNNTVAVAAYDDGCVDVWSTETGQEPVHHFQIPGRVHALALSLESPTLATAAGLDVRLDQPDERGYWRTLCQATLPKPRLWSQVESMVVVPWAGGRGGDSVPLVALSAGETVFLLAPEDLEPRVLHTVYGHPITCLDASASHAALGVKSCGWAMNDGGNKIHVYSLETGQSEMSVGNSAGDFSCVNLRDSPPHMLICGNKDRRVRVFDLRTGSSVTSLYAHHMGVTSVQADDWKIVSGGGEGLVCVWEMRMGAKLWEMHNRHPVRHLRFNTSTLVTANIPDEKSPRGACITDDDLTAHRRHRGVICHYDFSEDSTSQDHVLPICRSNYVESSGYNYNIGLAVPYDILSGSHPSH
ncbi:F-box/WD repeat-containing protein 8 isoform X1 [Oncorhynchus keta]|uniref:F-box/WD repeat-containing protein 8 isoform X1 n=1 Tax=Oncorhynchus keta TaxID=8018 RepID=UPI0015FAA7AC|nr:F-box/WD repeat-containing protein 8 isoform X1 [Oncorhynchus keta]